MLEELVGDVTTEYVLLEEIYSALHNCAPFLAAMGVRALIETVMIAKVGDLGNFSKNLNALQDNGHISKLDILHLQDVLEVGNAAIHRAHRPSVHDVLNALDIAETLVKRLHLDKNIAADLKKSTPPRLSKC